MNWTWMGGLNLPEERSSAQKEKPAPYFPPPAELFFCVPTQAPLAPALIPFETSIYGDAGLIPGWGRSPGEGNSNPLQYSCLDSPMDRGAWRTIWLQRVGQD